MQLWRSLVIFWVALRYGLLSRQPRAVRLRLALESLGPIFVKFGQVLSTRRDLLPDDYALELAKLQDRVKPFAGEVAIQIIERSLGKSVGELFVEFDQVPVASASIAQVHFAKLQVGAERREVAVKVLRPKMKQAIERDLSLMRTLAIVASWSQDGKRLKPREVVAEFDMYLHDEIDLIREAANCAQLKRNMQSLGLVEIPEVYWDFCSNEVMTMQRMHGIPISHVEELRAAGVDLTQLAKDGVRIFYTQVFRDAFFHADMHPGNIFVSVAPEQFGHYISLDFGIVGTLSENDKEYLAQNFAAFFNRDYLRVAQLHIDSGWVPADTRVTELEAAIRAVCEPFFNRPMKEVSLGLILMRLFQVSRRFKVEIQPQLVLLQKTLLNIEGLGRQLDPDLDLWAVSKPILNKWMLEQFGPKRFLQQLREHAPQYIQLMPKLPILFAQYLQNHSKQDELDAARHSLAKQKQSLTRWRVALGVCVALVLLLLTALLLLLGLGGNAGG